MRRFLLGLLIIVLTLAVILGAGLLLELFFLVLKQFRAVLLQPLADDLLRKLGDAPLLPLSKIL